MNLLTIQVSKLEQLLDEWPTKGRRRWAGLAATGVFLTALFSGIFYWGATHENVWAMAFGGIIGIPTVFIFFYCTIDRLFDVAPKDRRTSFLRSLRTFLGNNPHLAHHFDTVTQDVVHGKVRGLHLKLMEIQLDALAGERDIVFFGYDEKERLKNQKNARQWLNEEALKRQKKADEEDALLAKELLEMTKRKEDSVDIKREDIPVSVAQDVLITEKLLKTSNDSASKLVEDWRH